MKDDRYFNKIQNKVNNFGSFGFVVQENRDNIQ